VEERVPVNENVITPDESFERSGTVLWVLVGCQNFCASK
jgi:hypothetical protein